MTTNVYDDAGRLVRFIDQRGNATKYTFDKESRLIAETTPLDEVTSYIYGSGTGCSSCGTGGHSAGHLSQIIDPAGRSTYNTYDSMGRITKTTFSGSSGEVTYAYDAAGRRTSVTDTRLPASLLGNSGTFDVFPNWFA